MLVEEMTYMVGTRVLLWRLEEEPQQLLALCREQRIPVEDLEELPAKRQREKAAERLLLLDEPVTGLDPESSQNMYSIIKDLHENKNMTIVMVTHDIEAAHSNATRILNFNELVH